MNDILTKRTDQEKSKREKKSAQRGTRTHSLKIRSLARYRLRQPGADVLVQFSIFQPIPVKPIVHGCGLRMAFSFVYDLFSTTLL